MTVLLHELISEGLHGTPSLAVPPLHLALDTHPEDSEPLAGQICQPRPVRLVRPVGERNLLVLSETHNLLTPEKSG